MNKLYFLLFTLCFFSVEPGSAQEKSTLIKNVTLHLGTGRQVTEAALGTKDGQITYMGKVRDLDNQVYDTIIDLNGSHIYPGFIAGNTTLGLFEIAAVKASLDYEEMGEIMPHVRSYVAFNAESKVNATALSNGVLIAQSTPRGRMLAGSSTVFHLGGLNFEESALKIDDGLHLYWPKNKQNTGWWAEPGPTVKNKYHDKSVETLTQFFLEAKAYLKEELPAKKNLRMEAMRNVFEGKQALYIHADAAKDIAESIQFCRKFDVKKIVIVGGADAWKVTQLLKDNQVSVMVGRVHALPNREDEDIDLPYKLPFLLHQAGIKFCFENAGDMEQMQVRNFPFYGGTAVNYGLPYDAAIQALTLHAAEILGIDAKYGSLERGKSATFFVSAGDALNFATHKVTHVFINGEPINLDNHQKQLYRKYKARNEKLMAD